MTSLSLKEAELQADRLFTRLKALGVPIKKTQACEGVAAVHNFKDWNRFRANVARNAGGVAAAAAVVPVSFSAFSLLPQEDPVLPKFDTGHRLLVLRPGEGKTTMLLMRMDAAIRQGGDLPVFINCRFAFAPNRLPPSLVDGVAHVVVDYDKDGRLGHVGLPRGDCRGLIVSLNPVGIGIGMPQFFQATTDAFCEMAARLREWSQIDRVKTVLIDEFAGVDDDDERLFSSVLPRLALRGARLIIATQYFRRMASLAPLRFTLLTHLDSTMCLPASDNRPEHWCDVKVVTTNDASRDRAFWVRALERVGVGDDDLLDVIAPAVIASIRGIDVHAAVLADLPPAKMLLQVLSEEYPA